MSDRKSCLMPIARRPGWTSSTQSLWAAPANLVAFDFGKGMVVHVISHFHLQGSEERGEYISAYILTNVIDEAIRRRHPEQAAPRIRLIESGPAARPARIRILNRKG